MNMQRRDFLRNTALFGASAALGLQSESALAQGATPQNMATSGSNGAPVVGYTTGESTTITWSVQGASTGWVEYGETPALGQTVMPLSGGLYPLESLVLRVQISGLKPGTRYYYRTHTCPIQFNNAYDVKRGEVVVSNIASFTTLNPSAQSASFVLWNDTHDYRDTLTKLHALTSELKPDFLFHNGDVSNDIVSEEMMASLFLNPYNLPFAQNYPLFLGRGNHDVRGKAARHLPEFVAVPHDQFYYSFRQGPLAVLVMDTGEDKPDSHPVYAGLTNFAAYRTQQQQWLEQEIKKPEFRKAPFRVLFCHIPLWWKDDSEGRFCPDGRAKWHDLLVKAKIQLVVSGHTHQAFHLPPAAQRPYHQLIGGGPALESATLIRGQVQTDKMTVTMQDLSGEVLATLEFKS